MNCPHCGRSNPDQNRFCMHCGAALEERTSPATPASPGPGAAVPTSAPPHLQSQTDYPSAPAAAFSGVYAGFWIRFLAIFIDWLVIQAASLIIVVPVSVLSGVGMAMGGDPTGAAGEAIGRSFGVLFGLVGAWLYEAFMLSSSKQATLGKMAVSVTVTDTGGQRLSFARATGRHFGKYVSSILLIGYLIQPFTEKRQALHDILAGTLVFKKQ